MKTRLRPFLPSELDFDRPGGIKHTEDERGTQWALLAGPGGTNVEEGMKTWVRDQLKASGDYSSSPPRIHFHFQEWKIPNQYNFHLVVYCSRRMREIISLIEAGDPGLFREKFRPDQHGSFNAAGLPCLYIAAQKGRVAIFEYLLFLETNLLNMKFGPESKTILHFTVQECQPDILTALLQRPRDLDRCAKDIFGRTPFHYTAEGPADSAELLYRALCPEEKSTMSACDLLQYMIQTLSTFNIQEVFKIVRLILRDKEFDWSPQEPSPYTTAIYAFQDWCTKIADLPQEEPNDILLLASFREPFIFRDANIKLARLMVESLVPVRSYDDHGSTAVLVCFQYAPQGILQAMLESLPQRHQRREFPICVSVNRDGDCGLTIAKRRSPDFLRIAEAWRDQDMKPEVLQHFIERKDYRPAAELYLHQRKFNEALECLDEIKQSDWTSYTRARAYLGLALSLDEEVDENASIFVSRFIPLANVEQSDWSLSKRTKICPGLAQCSLVHVDDNPSILRLKSHIALALEQPSAFIDLNWAAYSAESKQRLHAKAMLQKELCEQILKPTPLSADIVAMVVDVIVGTELEQ
ncbi:MAG: hypothetical protein Q9201_007949 [Fulgogasparrea decipioides]